jgi:hypothetical protein
MITISPLVFHQLIIIIFGYFGLSWPYNDGRIEEY